MGIARTIDLFLSDNIMGKMVTINIARSALILAVLIFVLVQVVKSDINEVGEETIIIKLLHIIQGGGH